MQKYYALFFLTISFAASAQKTAPHWEPVNIDSLKNLLLSKQDTARINLLNEISFAYFYIQMDSSKLYALKAYQEASASDYNKGQVVSLLYQGQWELLAGDHRKAKQQALQAYEISKKGDDKKSLAVACSFLGLLSPKEEGLLLVNIADSIFKGIHNIDGQLDGYAIKGILFLRAGQTYDALKIYSRYAALGKESGNVEGYANAIHLIGRIYSVVGDYTTAIVYLNQSVVYREKHQQQFLGGYDEIFENYLQLKKYDSALYAINKFIVNNESIIKDPLMKRNALVPAFVKKANAYLKLGLYDTAIHILLPIVNEYKNKKNREATMLILSLVGEAYVGKKEYRQAVIYGQEAMRLAPFAKVEFIKKAAASVLATAYHNLKQNDSAYYYLQLTTTLNDSLTAKNLQNNITFYKTVSENEAAEAKIEVLDKDNQLKQQRLNILIGSLVVLVLLSGFGFRFLSVQRQHEAARRALAENELQIEKLEGEKKHASLQKHAAELEMQALRAQMNPHFIFNSLNAINHFILKAETDIASGYLTKFSRLIRMVLQNSSHKDISLEDELATLRLYIELEQLRFKKSFRFIISVDGDVDTEGIVIPPMLLQPFIENAIWHGLMHKEEKGLLSIEISNAAEMLICTITDNGAGRENPADNSLLMSSKKSMGMQITAHRLKLFGTEKGSGFFTVIDLKDENNTPCGTKVIVKIPVNDTKPLIV